MRYQVSLVIPPATPITALATESLLLPQGTLDEFELYFPWGCAGYVHVRIMENERQLYPTTDGEWFAGNEILIKFSCQYELVEAWNSFRVEGYNEDDFNPHTPIVSFTVLPVATLYYYPPLVIGA